MPPRVIDRIRAAIRGAEYDMTIHAVEEMAEDQLDLVDVETAILNGRLVEVQRDDPRGTRYIVHGTGADGTTPVGTVGRFTGARRYLIITAYKVTELET